MSNEQNLCEGLHNAEPLNAQRQAQFQAELNLILEPQLPVSHRLYYKLSLAGMTSGLFGSVCGLIFDAQNRLIYGLSAAVCAASVVWTAHILRRGSEPIRAMQGMSKAMSGLCFAGMFILISYGLRQPSLEKVIWAIGGLAVLMGMNFINLWNRVLLAERNSRMQTLRVEHKLAMMMEKKM